MIPRIFPPYLSNISVVMSILLLIPSLFLKDNGIHGKRTILYVNRARIDRDGYSPFPAAHEPLLTSIFRYRRHAPPQNINGPTSPDLGNWLVSSPFLQLPSKSLADSNHKVGSGGVGQEPRRSRGKHNGRPNRPRNTRWRHSKVQGKQRSTNVPNTPPRDYEQLQRRMLHSSPPTGSDDSFYDDNHPGGASLGSRDYAFVPQPAHAIISANLPPRSPQLGPPSLAHNHAVGPTCVDIPQNLTLCRGIGYGKMRLPNLLDHDTLNEVVNQARSWVPLLSVGCHTDARLFLCSLYSPVCLDRPIYPCRSLCLAVKSGCEFRMKQYGFPWPRILECHLFPPDNDLCIASQTVKGSVDRGEGSIEEMVTRPVQRPKEVLCEPCTQPATYESILDSYCRADIVLKIKTQDRLITFEPTNKSHPDGERDFYYQRSDPKHHASDSTKHLMRLKDFKVKRIFKRGTFLKEEFFDPKMIFAKVPPPPIPDTSHSSIPYSSLYQCSCQSTYSNSRSPPRGQSRQDLGGRRRSDHPVAAARRRQKKKMERSTSPSTDHGKYFLVMGNQVADKIIVTFGAAWNKREPTFRKAVNKLKDFDCGGGGGGEIMHRRSRGIRSFDLARWN